MAAVGAAGEKLHAMTPQVGKILGEIPVLILSMRVAVWHEARFNATGTAELGRT